MLFGGLFVVVGLLVLYGARQRWSWLIDPPDELWFCYSQSFMKKLLGPSGLIKFTYGLGILFVAVGVFDIVVYKP